MSRSAALPLAAAAALLVKAAIGGWAVPCPVHGDLEPSWTLASRLDPGDPATWLEEYRHVGYAMLLRAGMSGIDGGGPGANATRAPGATAGLADVRAPIGYLRGLSLAGGAVALLALVVLARLALPPGGQAAAALAMLAVPHLGFALLLEGPDNPALATALAATAVAAFAIGAGAAPRGVDDRAGVAPPYASDDTRSRAHG